MPKNQRNFPAVAQVTRGLELERLSATRPLGAVTRVHFHGEWFVVVWSSEYWFGSDHLFQLANCLCALQSSLEGNILLCETHQWSCYFCISLNKGPVVPKTAQGGTDFMYVLEFFLPFCQPINFSRVDVNTSSLDAYTEIINAPLVEETLPQFQEEVLLIDEIEHFVHDLLVELLIVICGNEDIVHVDEDATRVFVLDFGKYSIHCSLKDCRGI